MNKLEYKRIQIKEALAKLMATENIVVEHAPIPTAAFDLINRRLLIPNWKNISEDVYSLLISHEVGHALSTPQEEWKKEVMEHKNGNFKNVVNIVEDVRIENLIQKKYPGSVRSFRAGYGELEKANLFGTDGKDISEFGILDRINLHFKIGHFGYAKVPFSNEEQNLVQKVQNCRTFSDVLVVAKELLEYAKKEAKEQGKDLETGEGGDIVIQADSKEDAEKIKKELEKQKDGSQEKGKEQKVTIEYKDGSQQKSGTEEGEEGEGKSVADEQHGDAEEVDITSETQNSFDEKMKKYIDLSSNVLYLNIPKYDLKKIVVNYKQVIQQFRDHYGYSGGDQQIVQLPKAQEALSNFRHNNKHVVNQLVNLFEMKKKAKADARALVSKTGKLDTNKVHSYRYNEDIFRKITLVPNGKNHGLVMIIDMSGSMHNSMSGTIAQVVNLVMFCKKVNIPFEVYGFSDNSGSKVGLDRSVITSGRIKDVNLPGDFSLRNYFSSRMSGAEYNEMLIYMMCLINYYSRNKRTDYYSSIPRSEQLGGTPLNEAIISLMQIVPEFKENNKLDIVNTVLLTDGDGTSIIDYTDENGKEKSVCTEHLFLRHFSTKKIWNITEEQKRRRARYSTRDITANLLDMYREITGTKMIGFYITNERSAKWVIDSMTYTSKEAEEQRKIFEEKKYAEVVADGYDVYYIVPAGDDLLTQGEDLEIRGKQIRTLERNFINAMKAKRGSRIMLNRFIEHIA